MDVALWPTRQRLLCPLTEVTEVGHKATSTKRAVLVGGLLHVTYVHYCYLYISQTNEANKIIIHFMF